MEQGFSKQDPCTSSAPRSQQTCSNYMVLPSCALVPGQSASSLLCDAPCDLQAPTLQLCACPPPTSA